MDAVVSIPEHAILLLLVQFALILGMARLCGEFIQRVGQPAVLGEIVGGILLGPSVLGLYWPGAFTTIFPPEALSFQLLEMVSWLGLIFLLFLVGLETDVKALRGLGRTTALVTTADLSLTFTSGVVIGYVLPEHFLGFVGNRHVLALFLGVGISITAIPVLAKILLELGMLGRNFGLTALGVGISEDLFGWLCLPVVLDLAQRGRVDVLSVLQALGVTLLFALTAWGLGRRAVPRLFQAVDHRLKMPHRRVTTAVILALGCAAITQYIGIHAVFGAFVAGMLVAQAPRFVPADRNVFEGFSFGVFSPIFFSFAGLQVRLHEVQEWGLFGLILGVAVAGKLLGAFIGGRLGGMKRVECLAMGIGMNARGSMEVVLALLGLSAGIISQELFSIIVLMAMATSLMTPPLLRLIAPYIPLGPDEIERARTQAAEASRIF
jgi:Kef-type K+ transport system membrane component KefB